MAFSPKEGPGVGPVMQSPGLERVRSLAGGEEDSGISAGSRGGEEDSSSDRVQRYVQETYRLLSEVERGLSEK